MHNASADLERTRPTPELRAPDHAAPRLLEISVLSHPDPSMLGARAWLDGSQLRGSLFLGRELPRFRTRAGAPERELGDAYISRRALQLRYESGEWCLSAVDGACSVELAGRHLSGTRRLASTDLEAGTALRLAHNTLLWFCFAGPARPKPAPACASLVGAGPVMRALRGSVAALARSDADVLLRGETGTGKELVAHALHEGSPRRAGPFVAVNMAALPEGLAAAELFGVRRGAYTGADRNTDGLFVQAEGGTLFLDEIADAPASLQPLLLRALEAREVRMVGGDFRRVDVRVISATEHDLDAPGSTFRAALRHRLAITELELAPLRRRMGDLGELIAALYGAALRTLGHGELDANPDPASQRAWTDFVSRCAAYRWPGNIRELRNILFRLALEGDPDRALPRRRLQQAESEGEVRAVRGDPSGATVSPAAPTAGSDDSFRLAWEQASYEVAATGRLLGISRPAVYRWIKRLPDCRLAGDVPEPELQEALARCGASVELAAAFLKVSYRGLRQRCLGGGPPKSAVVTA